MSTLQRALITTAALLVAASLALAGPLPLSVLGPDNPQLTVITAHPYPVWTNAPNTGGYGGGGFLGTVGASQTILWCVDSQRTFYWNESVPGSVHLISNLGDPSVNPEVQSSTVTNTSTPKWKYYNTDSFWDTAKTRYTAAAWLIEKYTNFPNGPSANDSYNLGIQKAIWSLLYTSAGGGYDPGDQSSGSWISAAKNALQQGYKAANWAVLSWGVYASGSNIGDLDPSKPRQTFLVQVVPEPGFYGLLGLALSALLLFARRRQSATS